MWGRLSNEKPIAKSILFWDPFTTVLWWPLQILCDNLALGSILMRSLCTQWRQALPIFNETIDTRRYIVCLKIRIRQRKKALMISWFLFRIDGRRKQFCGLVWNWNNIPAFTCHTLSRQFVVRLLLYEWRNIKIQKSHWKVDHIIENLSCALNWNVKFQTIY